MNDNDKIEILKTPQYLKTAQAVSDYLKSLPLTVEQNNRLIELLVTHEQQARHDAFIQGLNLGMGIYDTYKPFDGPIA